MNPLEKAFKTGYEHGYCDGHRLEPPQEFRDISWLNYAKAEGIERDASTKKEEVVK